MNLKKGAIGIGVSTALVAAVAIVGGVRHGTPHAAATNSVPSQQQSTISTSNNLRVLNMTVPQGARLELV